VSEHTESTSPHAVTTFNSACLVLFLALCFYILSFPIPLKQNASRIPRLYLPIAWLLETPVHRPLEWYLELWGVEPDFVLCALYP
jgi:hypothetical protein